MLIQSSPGVFSPSLSTFLFASRICLLERYRQKLALFEARDPTEFSRRCVEDPSLCRSVLRVYILGGGLRTSLEGVGKAVRDVCGLNHPTP